jgi:hypothetical protein
MSYWTQCESPQQGRKEGGKGIISVGGEAGRTIRLKEEDDEGESNEACRTRIIRGAKIVPRDMERVTL